MTKRQFWDLAYLRACSLPTSGFLSSDLASRTMRGKPLASNSRKSTKPLLVFSKLSPRASRSDDLMVTLDSRRMLAGLFPSGKKRQPAASSSLLILIRAVASLSDTLVPVSVWVVKRYNVRVDRARRLHPTFASIHEVKKHAPRAPVQR